MRIISAIRPVTTGTDEMTDEIEQRLRHDFERDFPRRLERYARSRVHQIIPDAYFDQASTECRKMYVDGHFYGCITLAQSIAEGISKFLAQKKNVRRCDHYELVNRLRDHVPPVISPESHAGFVAIHGTGRDRNDFHHMNPIIEQDPVELERRAFECIEALYTIESDVFGFDMADGVPVLRDKDYFELASPTETFIYFRRG